MSPNVYEKYKKHKKDFIERNLRDNFYEYKFITHTSESGF